MRLTTIICILLLLVTSCTQTAPYEFQYATPESKGHSSEKLALLKEHLEQSGSSSMLVLVDGEVIFEWGDTSQKHLIHSMRKALLNSLYGIAIKRGQIDTSMTLRELNINDIGGLSENELNATVSDLLRSRSGVYHDAAAVNNAMLRDRPKRDTYRPGEHYYYNNWDFNTLGAILEQKTGKRIYDLFYEEIAKPTGMLDYKGSYTDIDGEATDDETIPDTDGIYQHEKSKSQYPAYHFRMSARDLAIYRQLYLNYGVSNGKQLLSKEWIDTATKPYSIYNPKYGNAYGMLWYVRVPSETTIRNSFFHTGVGVHMLGVYPDSKLVMVHRVDTENGVQYQEGDFYKMIRLLFDSKITE